MKIVDGTCITSFAWTVAPQTWIELGERHSGCVWGEQRDLHTCADLQFRGRFEDWVGKSSCIGSMAVVKIIRSSKMFPFLWLYLELMAKQSRSKGSYYFRHLPPFHGDRRVWVIEVHPSTYSERYEELRLRRDLCPRGIHNMEEGRKGTNHHHLGVGQFVQVRWMTPAKE